MDTSACTAGPDTAASQPTPALGLSERRAIERAMIDRYALKTQAGPLSARRVQLADVSSVQIDGVSENEDVFVVACASRGPLGPEEMPHVARDIFSLSLVATKNPAARLVFLFGDEQALASVASWAQQIAGEHVLEMTVVPFPHAA